MKKPNNTMPLTAVSLRDSWIYYYIIVCPLAECFGRQVIVGVIVISSGRTQVLTAVILRSANQT